MLNTLVAIYFADTGKARFHSKLYLFIGEVPVLNVSYKPQKISPKSTVRLGFIYQVLHLLQKACS